MKQEPKKTLIAFFKGSAGEYLKYNPEFIMKAMETSAIIRNIYRHQLWPRNM